MLAVEAVWDSFGDSDAVSKVDDTVSAKPTQLFMALSKAVVGASSSSRAIRLHGMVHGHSVLVLVDLGSYASFISSALVAKLNGISSTPTHSEVRVAGGGILLSLAICHQLS